MLWFLALYWKSNNSVQFRPFRIILFLLNSNYWVGCIPIHQACIRLNQIYWSHFACNLLYSFLLTSVRKSCTTENCGGVVAIAVCPYSCFLHNKDPCVGKLIYAGGSSLFIWVVSIRNRIYSQVQLYLKYFTVTGLLPPIILCNVIPLRYLCNNLLHCRSSFCNISSISPR